jgi:PAS domain S-box-containing protein
MAAGKKKLDDKKPDTSGTGQSLRDDAEQQLAHTPKRSPSLAGQSPEQLIHELQVHQIELETQAEELRIAGLTLEESRDKFLDLYDFAPLGYITLSDKGLINDVNLTGAKLLGIERKKLVKSPFSKFITTKDSDPWYWYFLNVMDHEAKRSCTLMLTRKDGSVFPARLEGMRNTGSNGTITVRIAFTDVSDKMRSIVTCRTGITGERMAVFSQSRSQQVSFP